MWFRGCERVSGWLRGYLQYHYHLRQRHQHCPQQHRPLGKRADLPVARYAYVSVTVARRCGSEKRGCVLQSDLYNESPELTVTENSKSRASIEECAHHRPQDTQGLWVISSSQQSYGAYIRDCRYPVRTNVASATVTRTSTRTGQAWKQKNQPPSDKDTSARLDVAHAGALQRRN
jgi:hypothetical protein